jgi:cytidylate kinase
MDSNHNAIAIDGPAASGKSTVARRLAAKLSYLYVNSGAMYRAITWAILQKGVSPAASEEVVAALESIKLESSSAEGVSEVRVNGENPEASLSTEEVNRNVSTVSAIPEVRDVVVAQLVAYRDLDNVVMEGRDIGSVVFPDSKYKFYIDASEEIRNQRRRKQGLRDAIAERDRSDQTRKASPLIVSEDAHRIDSSEMSADEVVDEALKVLRDKGLELIA